MRAVEAFAAAMADPGTGSLDPGLLPERLARACVRSLPVDGAGITCTFHPGRRLPIGASDPEAAAAERLQFSIGEGPCVTAQTEQRMVVAAGDELAARWPVYTAQLMARTDYRGVVSVPLPGALAGVAALDVYLHRATDTAALAADDVLAVAGEVAAALADDLAGSGSRSLGMPAWMDEGPVAARQHVWRAVGYLVGRDGGSAGEALARLRARAFAQDDDVESVAVAVLDRSAPPPGDPDL
ncbi:GAF domain-containing protein [Klenkia sp. LSe6-5]|uniref:GAF domain-containing protein n=1 Tax=Klenkia sesuvii TaxID=3103137 RepID=A0ABU8DQW9_9ACTN